MEVNDQIIDHGQTGRSRIGLTGLLEQFVNVYHENLLIMEGHVGVSAKGSDSEVSHHGLESSSVGVEDRSISPSKSSHSKGLIE